MITRVLLLAGMLPAVGAWAQPTIRIRDAGTCPKCRIVMQSVVALGTADGLGMISSVDAQAIRTRAGSYIVRGMYAPSLTVFDRAGRYQRTLGREGGAPGEFRGIGSIASYRGDSLLVLDWGSRRFSVFDATLAYARGGPLPFTPGLATVAFPDGAFVHHVHVPTPERVGLPLHRLAADGSWQRSFGSATSVYRPDVPFIMRIRDEQGYCETILEVIEPSTGSLLASTRVDAHLRHFVDDAHVGTVIEHPQTGIPQLQVWRVALVRE